MSQKKIESALKTIQALKKEVSVLSKSVKSDQGIGIFEQKLREQFRDPIHDPRPGWNSYDELQDLILKAEGYMSDLKSAEYFLSKWIKEAEATLDYS